MFIDWKLIKLLLYYNLTFNSTTFVQNVLVSTKTCVLLNLIVIIIGFLLVILPNEQQEKTCCVNKPILKSTVFGWYFV